MRRRSLGQERFDKHVEIHILCEVQLRWIVTATPLINNKQDLLGLLALLWRDEWQTGMDLKADPTVSSPAFNVFENYPDDLMDPKSRLAS